MQFVLAWHTRTANKDWTYLNAIQPPYHEIDQYEVYDTYEYALERYNEIKSLPDTYSVSLCVPVLSTDYDCADIEIKEEE